MAASRHTHNFRKCSHASVGLAQARPNNNFAFCLVYMFPHMHKHGSHGDLTCSDHAHFMSY